MHALPAVDELADELADEVADAEPSSESLWHIAGPVTAGKSTLLRQLGALLASRGMLPLLVAPPSRALDAGPLALAQVAVSADRANGPRVQTEWVPERGTWGGKLGALSSWLRDQRDRVVVLCDDPGVWSFGGPEELHFARHADEVAWALLGGDMPCRRVVVGEIPVGLRPPHQRWLDVRTHPIEWLRAEPWGELAPMAEALEKRLGHDLERRTPLEIRLLVGLTALRGLDAVVGGMSLRPSRRDISRAFAEAVQEQATQGDPYLRTAWTRLALVRSVVTGSLLDRVAGAAPDPLKGAILRCCLLYPDNGHHRLHWTLARDVQQADSPWPVQSATQTHRLLAEHYTDEFRRTSGDGRPEALLDELEAFHHASMTGDEALLGELRPYFADQLDALGRTLSRDFRRYRDAAAAFERACSWEPDDDYAHHYLAFNLDILAEREDAVEEHYQKAISLASSAAWWHSRWVCYLITQGCTSRARNAWTDALDALGLPNPGADPWIYVNLHLWVARLLVHRAQLEFASQVLAGIPPAIREEHPGLRAIARRLEALVEAQKSGSVFPLTVAPADWWRGPHLCPRERAQGGVPLVRWMPARVDAVADGVVHLIAAVPPTAEDDVVQYGSVAIPADDFDLWSVDEPAVALSDGRFVELAWYGEEENPAIRVHRDARWMDPNMPPLFPDPARYLRAASWVKEQQ